MADKMLSEEEKEILIKSNQILIRHGYHSQSIRMMSEKYKFKLITEKPWKRKRGGGLKKIYPKQRPDKYYCEKIMHKDTKKEFYLNYKHGKNRNKVINRMIASMNETDSEKTGPVSWEDFETINVEIKNSRLSSLSSAKPS